MSISPRARKPWKGQGKIGAETGLVNAPRPFSRTLSKMLHEKEPCKNKCGTLTGAIHGYCQSCKKKWYMKNIGLKKTKVKVNEKKTVNDVLDFYREHDKKR